MTVNLEFLRCRASGIGGMTVTEWFCCGCGASNLSANTSHNDLCRKCLALDDQALVQGMAATVVRLAREKARRTGCLQDDILHLIAAEETLLNVVPEAGSEVREKLFEAKSDLFRVKNLSNAAVRAHFEALQQLWDAYVSGLDSSIILSLQKNARSTAICFQRGTMDYACIGENGSEVCVSPAEEGIVCRRCSLDAGEDHAELHATGMLDHLQDHIEAGECVPPEVIDRLGALIPRRD